MPLASASYSLADRACDKALEFDGIRETPGKQNTSPIIDKMIKRGGGRIGWPWCMYFVYYVVDEVCSTLEIDNPLKRTGSVAAQLHFAEQNYRKGLKVIYPFESYAKFKSMKGDILIFRKGGSLKKSSLKGRWNGHTAFVVSQINDNLLATIEGNTNKRGSREGDGVYRKTRKIKSTGRLKLGAIVRMEITIEITVDIPDYVKIPCDLVRK